MPPPRHVVVCGAGIMGASVAYFLAQRGVAVTIVERTGVACAASGKSGGFLALDWCDDSPLGPLARASGPSGESSHQSSARNPPDLPEAAHATPVRSTMVTATPRCARK